MAFVRPIVYVYQEMKTVSATVSTPDLNCCLVGPVFHIEDYPEDDTDIRVKDAGGDVIDFIKTGKTEDVACGADGSSGGRPDAGTNFLVMDEPPNHTPGAMLDADSVDTVFVSALIELGKAIDGDTTAETVLFESSSLNFLTTGAEAGDRLVITDAANPGDDTKTIVKIIKEVAAGSVTVTKKFTDEDLTKIGGTGSPKTVANALFRVEHRMATPQHIDGSLYTTIVGNQITIKTSALGLKVTYDSATYLVNYAEIYIGYRELRLDLQDVKTLDDSSYITSVLGKIDERNPVAVGAQVAFANTQTPIQIFGVASDDLTGHNLAKNNMSARNDIYAIVPLTDALTGAAWTTGVLAAWNDHVIAFEDSEISKFRMIVGSYDTLPTDKSSAPPSLVGHTLLDPAGAALVDVFVDPETNTNATQFVTDGVGSTSTNGHFLEMSHNNDGEETVIDTKTIFDESHAPIELYGAIGEKRLRTNGAVGSVYAGANPSDYVVRSKILQSEGGQIVVSKPIAITTDVSGIKCTGSNGDFATVDVDDMIAVLTANTGTYGNKAYTIVSKGALDEYLILATPWIDDQTGTLVMYEPALSVKACNIEANNAVVLAGEFVNVADGDLAFVISTTDANDIGMWVVASHTDDQVTLTSDKTMALEAANATHIIFYRSVSSRGSATIHMRKRLTRLRDDGASFLTTVDPKEMIEIPYPADIDPTKWDTATTQWPIESVVSDEYLDAALETLEELAPDMFIEGFDGDMSYRISIELDKAAQVTELNTITESFKSKRLVMTWPNEVYVTDVNNGLTGVRSRQRGQFLSCAVGGMIAGLPPHQGFTFIGIGGIEQIFNSNFYFTDAQIAGLAEGGWFVFLQDSESSLPYSAFEVTTDTSSYETGELMAVKNFDYISLYYKEILEAYLGRYNILPETLELIRSAINNGTDVLMLRTYPRIGAPLISAEITVLEQLATEVDRVEAYLEVIQPTVLNKIGLHLMK